MFPCSLVLLFTACGDGSVEKSQVAPSQEEGINERVVCVDDDGDRADYCYDTDTLEEVIISDGRDCDDADPAINPYAIENCSNGVDDDCDGFVDDADPTPGGPGGNSAYNVLDADGDGHVTTDADGDGRLDEGVVYLIGCAVWTDENQGLLAAAGLTPEQAAATLSLYIPSTEVLGDDCDDAASNIYNGAPETCDDIGIDNNCDEDPNGFDPGAGTNWYPDADEDGFGAGVPVLSCEPPIIGSYTTTSGDCNDVNWDIFPGAPETCADIGVDNNCDGDLLGVDEGETVEVFSDMDDDGFAANGAASAGFVCVPGANQATAFGDCNDDPVTGAAQYPGALEVCDTLGVDNDCDGVSDEASDELTWWEDIDHDGFGGQFYITSCVDPSSPIIVYTSTAGDCNDFLGYVNPEAVEVYGNLTDDNCDGAVDERGGDCSSTVIWTDPFNGDLLDPDLDVILAVNGGTPIQLWPSDGMPAPGVTVVATDLGDAMTIQVGFSTCWDNADQITLWGVNAAGDSLCETDRMPRWNSWVSADSLNGFEPWYTNDEIGFDLDGDGLFDECKALITRTRLPVP